MSYQSPFNFPGPGGESYSTPTPTTPLEGLDFQLPQWETVERERQQQQQQQQQHQEHQRQLSYAQSSQPPTPTAHNTIQLDEQAPAAAPHPPPARVVPSQMHLETGPSVQLHAYHGHGHEGRSGLINTLDYSRLSTQPSDILRPISISPTAPTPTSGLVARPTRGARAEAHPYKRPQSAVGTKTPTIPLRPLQEGSTSRRHASSSIQAVRSGSGGSSR